MMSILPAHEVNDLIKLDSNAAKKALRGLSEEIALSYLSELYKGNGWVVSFTDITKHTALLLSDPKNPNSILLIVKFLIREHELTYDEAREALIDFENNLSAKYGCSQFAIISLNGIAPKAEKLEQFNLLLQDWAYVDDLIANYSTTKIQEPQIQLFAHNKQTYKKVCNMMNSVKSIAVVQATGTGKSFLIAKLLQDFTGEKRLVMAPSLYIIEQVKEHIRWDAGNIEYMTYARSMNLSQNEIASINPKMIVLDEFHRCGAEEWGRGVQNILNAYPEAFKFGTSATPVRYMDNARDMSRELFNNNVAENLSLAQSIVRNILPMPKYVCALYTLGEEVENMKEKVASSRAGDDTKNRILLELDAVNINWERSNGVTTVLKKYLNENMRKFIVFCRDEEHLFEMEPVVSGWFMKALDGITVKTYRIFDGEPKSGENLEAFKSADTTTALHLLLSINMLNEGLHVNEVSGVVLLRPTESPNIFYQQIGRCLKVGLNYSPVIFDLVNNFRSIRTHDFLWDLEFAHSQYAVERKNENLEDRCPVFTVMDEVREITEVFGEIKFRLDNWERMFEQLAEYKGRFGDCNVIAAHTEYRALLQWLNRERNKFKKGILEPERRDKLVALGVEWRLDELTGDQDEGWEKQFEKLCLFREKYGHCNVTIENKEFGKLFNFVRNQRHRYDLGTLEEYRINKLNAIGFQFKRNFLESQWQQYFDELVAFKKEHGHLKSLHRLNLELYNWVRTQRKQYKKNKVSAVRMQKLNSIGFEWGEDSDALFEEKFAEMVAFHQQHQHFKFPFKHKLYAFAENVRLQYKRKKLPVEKIQRLEAIGFNLQLKESNLTIREERLKQYEHFFELNSHGNVTRQNENYKGLHQWLIIQRVRYTKGLLTEESIKRMEAAGVEWMPMKNQIDSLWNSNYKALLDIYKKTGKSILKKNKGHKLLLHWCTKQRTKYKQGQLSEEQIKKLNAINFKWELAEATWEENYAALAAYKKKHGHCRMQQKKSETKALGMWCSHIRDLYKKGKLPPEKIKRLEFLGFMWKVRDTLWETKYKRLKKLLQRYTWEHISNKDKILNGWLSKQRIEYKEGSLSEERIMLLNKVGMDWGPAENKWDKQYNALLAYRESHGTTRLSSRDKSYKELFNWCDTQQRNYRNNKIPPNKLELLNKIGFEWRVKIEAKSKVN